MLMTWIPNCCCLVLPSIGRKLVMSTVWFMAAWWKQRQVMQQCVDADIAVLKLLSLANDLLYMVRNVVYDPGAHGHVVLSHWFRFENSEPGLLLSRLAVVSLLIPLMSLLW